MMRNAKICLALCIVAALARGQLEMANPRRGAYDCRVDNLPTSWSFENAPGMIYAHHARFGELGQTFIDMGFRNGGAIPIQALALVVEYADEKGQIIDRVPIVAAANPAIAASPPNVLSPANTWKNPLSRNDSAILVAVSDGVRTGSCPVRAEVTFARVQFSDGNVQTHSSPRWRLGPIPRRIPPLSRSAQELPLEAPASLRARLQISALGEVIDVVPEESAEPKLVNWIRAWMKRNWKFYPALVNGKPTESALRVLFLIYAKGMTEFPDIKPVLEPVTVIRFAWSHDLSPHSRADDKLAVMYGALLEGSRPPFPFEEFASTN